MSGGKICWVLCGFNLTNASIVWSESMTITIALSLGDVSFIGMGVPISKLVSLALYMPCFNVLDSGSANTFVELKQSEINK